MKRRYIVVFGFGLVCLVVGFWAIENELSSPKQTFEKLIAKPVPKSVQFIEEGSRLAMDSIFQVMRFQISNIDLRSLLRNQHFTPIDESKEFKGWDQNSQDYIQIPKKEFLEQWKRRIQSSTKVKVNFTESWQIYTLKENHGRKYIFADTYGPEVVFIAMAPD
jgi:hypothetical protein